MAQSRMALITFLDNNSGNYPDNSLPGGGYPSQGLPGGGYPSTGPILPPGGVTLPVFPWDPTDPGYGKPGGGRPDNSLPGSGGRPDNSLPGSGGRPDNSLPGGGNISNELPRPGKRYIVKWLACTGLILVPDNSLPGQEVDNELPPTAEPK
jgi:hypothetical protein